MKSVTGRYVNILVDKDEWLGNQRIVFQTVDLEAFREDGYVLSKAGERLFGNFFIREILQQDEVRWLIALWWLCVGIVLSNLLAVLLQNLTEWIMSLA